MERRKTGWNSIRLHSASATVTPETRTVRPAVATVRATARSTCSFPVGRGSSPQGQLRLAAEFLAEPGDDEQAVVDAEAEAQDRGDVHRVDGDRGGQREQAEHGERAEDREAADRERREGGDHAAEDDHQEDEQHGERDRLGPRDVRADRAVDGDLGGRGAADLGGDAVSRRARPGGEVRLVSPCTCSRRAWSESAGELEDRVGRVPVGGDQVRLPARPVGDGPGHLRLPGGRPGSSPPPAGSPGRRPCASRCGRARRRRRRCGRTSCPRGGLALLWLFGGVNVLPELSLPNTPVPQTPAPTANSRAITSVSRRAR